MSVQYKSMHILEEIYVKVFQQVQKNEINIFLCGGVKTNPNCIRDNVRDIIIQNKDIKVLYPEDMFLDLLNKEKEADLLSYEKFLANNSDYICIICESPGALVELGAFVNNERTFSKVIALIEEIYKKDKSFIMLGPIKYLKKNNKENVIFYDKNNIEEIGKRILHRIRKNRYKYLKSYGIDTLMGLKDFITLIFYFYSKVNYNELVEKIEFIWTKFNVKIEEKNTLINASLKLLFKEKMIGKASQKGKDYYYLTEKGHDEIFEKMYNKKNKVNSKLYDEIRFAIMYNEMYKNSSS